jgi:hypothetical protein
MDNVEGFRLCDLPAGEAPADTGDSPGTTALRLAIAALLLTHAQEACMAAPGTVPETPDVFPYGKGVEQELFKIAQLLRQVTQRITLLKKKE